MIITRFTMPGCAPCRALEADLQKRGIDLPAIDASAEGKGVAKKYGIRSVPAIVFDSGNGHFEVFSGSQINDTVKARLVDLV